MSKAAQQQGMSHLHGKLKLMCTAFLPGMSHATTLKIFNQFGVQYMEGMF